METPKWMQDPIGAAERGENPTVVARLPSGFAVMGFQQFLPGYMLLLGVPKAERLEDMRRDLRTQFLNDMATIGEAISSICKPRRVNYGIYGNTAPYVHAHIAPRYEWESSERIVRPPWEYPPETWNDPAKAFDAAKHDTLRTNLAMALRGLMR